MGRPTVVALKSNSVFDWADGSERSGGDDLDLPAVHKTRYNPNPRIGDITDLVEESSDDDIDNSIKVGNNSSNQYGPTRKGTSLVCRQVVFAISVVAIIIGAGLMIGYVITNNDKPTINSSALLMVPNNNDEQQLLETAERVVIACSESKLDNNISECQKLCTSHLCCFETDEYGCQDDISKDCAVYAACEALVEGIVVEAAEQDEE